MNNGDDGLEIPSQMSVNERRIFNQVVQMFKASLKWNMMINNKTLVLSYSTTDTPIYFNASMH